MSAVQTPPSNTLPPAIGCNARAEGEGQFQSPSHQEISHSLPTGDQCH